MSDSATSRSGSPAATRFKARPRLMLGQLGPAAEPRALGGADADDPQIGFRELQRELHPDLTKEQWLNLFTLWREHDNERLRTELAARRARVAKLEDARRAAFITRTLMPPQGDDELERVAAQMKPRTVRPCSG